MEEGVMTVSELEQGGVFQEPKLCEEIIRNLLAKCQRLQSCMKRLEEKNQELCEEKDKLAQEVLLHRQASVDTTNDNLKVKVESLENGLRAADSKIADLERSFQIMTSEAQLKTRHVGFHNKQTSENNDRMLCDNYIRLVRVIKGSSNDYVDLDPLYQEVDTCYPTRQPESTSTTSDESNTPHSQEPGRIRSSSSPLPPVPFLEELQTPVGDLTSATSSKSDLYSGVRKTRQPAPRQPIAQANLATEDRSNSSEFDVPQVDSFSFSSGGSLNHEKGQLPSPANISGDQVGPPKSQHKDDKGVKRGKKGGTGLKAKFGQHF